MATARKMSMLLTATLVVQLFAPRYATPQVAELAGTVKSLADALADIPGTGNRVKNLAKFAFDEFGADGRDKLIEVATKELGQSNARSLPDHLLKVHQAGNQLRQGIASINTQLPETPDFSHLPYCSQIRASEDQLARIRSATKTLGDAQNLSKSYLGAMVQLEEMSKALADFWRKMLTLGIAYDVATEKTTYGEMVGLWQFWTEKCSGGGDMCAAYLLEQGRKVWTENERTVGDKLTKLRAIEETRGAYHEHFYSSPGDRCSNSQLSDSATPRSPTVLEEALKKAAGAVADIDRKRLEGRGASGSGDPLSEETRAVLESTQNTQAVKTTVSTTGPSATTTLSTINQANAEMERSEALERQRTQGLNGIQTPAQIPSNSSTPTTGNRQRRCNELDAGCNGKEKND